MGDNMGNRNVNLKLCSNKDDDLSINKSPNLNSNFTSICSNRFENNINEQPNDK